jgi:hypothetical protein
MDPYGFISRGHETSMVLQNYTWDRVEVSSLLWCQIFSRRDYDIDDPVDGQSGRQLPGAFNVCWNQLTNHP